MLIRIMKGTTNCAGNYWYPSDGYAGVLGPHRSTHRKVPCGADDEQQLTEDIIALAKQYGRYGYRRVTTLLRHAGWTVNPKRVERIWSAEGLKVPQKQPKRGRLWLNDGSCIRLHPATTGVSGACMGL